MLLWWEMSRPVWFSCFALKLDWSLGDTSLVQLDWSLGQHQSFWTLMSQFVPGVRIPRSRHFAVHAPHPSHPPASVPVSWDTSSVPLLSQSSFFLCPFCPSAALRHITHGSVPPCGSYCKINIVLVLACLGSFQANHIYYVSVHHFTQRCMMSVRGSWKWNNINTNQVRKIWENRTMWRAGINPMRSGISSHGWSDQELAKFLLQTGGWIRNFQKPFPGNSALIQWLLIKLAHWILLVLKQSSDVNKRMSPEIHVWIALEEISLVFNLL